MILIIKVLTSAKQMSFLQKYSTKKFYKQLIQCPLGQFQKILLQLMQMQIFCAPPLAENTRNVQCHVKSPDSQSQADLHRLSVNQSNCSEPRGLGQSLHREPSSITRYMCSPLFCKGRLCLRTWIKAMTNSLCANILLLLLRNIFVTIFIDSLQQHHANKQKLRSKS